jgi:hypothetical protein
MMTRRVNLRREGLAVLAALLMLLPSCSGDIKFLKTYPVTGKILVDGKPVKGVAIVLHPTDPLMVRERPFGETDADGKFTLSTYNANDGAPAGDFLVAIAIAVKDDDGGNDQKAAVKNSIPARFGKGETSGLKVTIEKKTNELKPFELPSK